MKLKTEQNTKSMMNRVLKAARISLRERKLQADFEHGQWWISSLKTGAQWSVVDAEGGPAVNGFDFEMVTEPEEY